MRPADMPTSINCPSSLTKKPLSTLLSSQARMAKPGGAKKRPTGAKPRRGKPGAGMRKRQQQNRRQKLTGDKRKAPPGPVEKPESAALAGAGIGAWGLWFLLERSWANAAPAAAAAALRPLLTAAAASCPLHPTGGASGDADDFGYLLDSMQDYKPPADSGDEGGDDAAADVAAGSGGSDGEAADAAAGGSKAAKPRRKRGQKLSSLEFEASRQMARQIGECSAEDQADWLWSSFQQHAAASGLERGGLAESGVAALPAQGSLEERLKGLAAAGGWQAAFCSREGPAGAPALLLVSPSAIGAVNLIKLCPQFNRVGLWGGEVSECLGCAGHCHAHACRGISLLRCQASLLLLPRRALGVAPPPLTNPRRRLACSPQACRIGKLFAKHFKVAEQEEALRSQVGEGGRGHFGEFQLLR